jgi:hypothetical protein
VLKNHCLPTSLPSSLTPPNSFDMYEKEATIILKNILKPLYF